MVRNKGRRRNRILFALLCAGLLFCGCSQIKNGRQGAETSAETTPGLQPIDIPAPKFFWLLQPWRDGKLVTYDGWGRFAEISFVGANRMRIKHLVDFPRVKVDRELITFPEAGLIAGRTGDVMHHLAAIDDKKTKSHIPLFTRAYDIEAPVLLDPNEGLIGYCYVSTDSTEVKLYLYNYKEDRMVYQSPDRFSILMIIGMNDQYALCRQGSIDERTKERENRVILYNWRTNEILENNLTEAINQNGINPMISPDHNIHLSKRCFFEYSSIIRQRVKITWDENYEDVTVTPLSYLVPEGKRLDDFILSFDGSWGTSFVGGYRGSYNERLYKRAFFHLDERYPNGISMPVITDDYEEYQWEYTAFVEHPVHGMCFAQEWHKEGKLYLRLYKMSDVLAEINRQLPEKDK